MVSVAMSADVERDYSRAAKVLIAIQLRLLAKDYGEEHDDEPNPGVCEGLD
jgi:hypothetical protein